VLGSYFPGAILNSKAALMRKVAVIQVKAITPCKFCNLSIDKLEAMSLRPQFDRLKNNIANLLNYMSDITKSAFIEQMEDLSPDFDIIPHNIDT
jgi:hypothetical protein